MQPEIPQPMFSGPPTEPPKKSHKKLIIAIIIVLVFLIAGGVGAYFFLKPKPTPDNTVVPDGSFKPVEFGSESTPITYAGHKMYDACTIIPQHLLEKHVEGYKDVYQSLGGDRTLQNPVKIEHGYIDRNIPNVLGNDDKPREPSISISTDKVDSTIRARSFMSIADSHCLYGSGIAFNLQYAQVHIIQPPTPLPPKLLTLLDELKQQGHLIAEVEGIQAYVDVKEGDSEIVLVLKKGDVVMFVASKYADLIQDASDLATQVLVKGQVGPMTAKYPAPYAQLINPCSLFSADDFERLLGKKADSITAETLHLTETEEKLAERECARYEVERLRQGEVTTSTVILGEARTDEEAKKRLANVKAEGAATPVSDLGDEAYLVAVSGNTAHPYKYVVRVGKRLVEIMTSGEAKDVSADAFAGRTLPVAKVVLGNLKK
jgi:hypothetical protein